MYTIGYFTIFDVGMFICYFYVTFSNIQANFSLIPLVVAYFFLGGIIDIRLLVQVWKIQIYNLKLT